MRASFTWIITLMRKEQIFNMASNPPERSKLEKLTKAFNVIKEDKIPRNRRIEDYDLEINETNQIAKYDSEVVFKVLNSRDLIKGSFLEKSIQGLKNTLIFNTFGIVIVYLIMYYTVHCFYVQNLHLSSEKNSTLGEFQTLIDKNFQGFVKHYKGAQANLLKIMTFLVGFYVKKMMERWWSQVSSVPGMESVCLAMNGIGWHVADKGGIDGMIAFKSKIARYCLLSWTMCFSGISKPLHIKFTEKDAFIEKGLITKDEWRAIMNEGGSKDGWKDKWWIPLSWAFTIINEDEKNGKGLFKDHKYIMSNVGNIGHQLAHISEYAETPVPPIQNQACTIAAWVLLILGVFAGQTEHFAEHDGVGDISAEHRLIMVVSNFPVLQCIVFLLIFGWLNAGSRLNKPFGSDYEFAVDTVSRLDYEIWMASNLINKNSLLATPTKTYK